MSIADEFITGGMNAKQQQDMGVVMANIYKGALDSTQDPVLAERVLTIFVSGVLQAAKTIPPKKTQ
jgi:hypothetical protein